MQAILNVQYVFADNSGAYSVEFRCEFFTSFVPFFGMSISVGNGLKNVSMDLVDTDLVSTTITYFPVFDVLLINVRNRIAVPIEGYVLDAIIEQFAAAEFERTDQTDLDAMKAAMVGKQAFLEKNQLVRNPE